MGTKVSLFCCSYCNTRVSTEEDEFLGIRAEVKQKQKEQIPLPFQEYLKRRNSLTDHDSMLNFLANPQIDYLTTDNKIMQRSAILDINEIPEIPTPKNDKLSMPLIPCVPLVMLIGRSRFCINKRTISPKPKVTIAR